LIAPNAFKGTIAAEDAAQIILEELGKESNQECIIQPVADGGDGTCGLLIESLGLEKITIPTLNSIGLPIQGFMGWDSSTKRAFLDVSTASGLGMLEEFQKDPETTSTFGTGILIKKAVEIGAEEIVLGLGGSATIDMGTGILSALGILFLDESGRELPVYSPGFLSKIRHIQKSPTCPKIRFTCLCDVRNQFFGPAGAIRVFGPQKGLPPAQFDRFEKQCESVLQFMRKKTKSDWNDRPGYGAAGGIALGLDFFFETGIQYGAEYFFEQVDMEKKILQSDWIITGEGRYDAQSDQGKASFQLLQLAKKYGKKIALITSGPGGKEAGFDRILVLPDLDFQSPDFKEKARENLRGLIQTAIQNREFD
jgi:glycerate kinase